MVALSRQIFPQAVRDTVKRVRPVYDLTRQARIALGAKLGARYVPGLRGRAHYNDLRLISGADRHAQAYRREALDFVDVLGRALVSAGRSWSDVWNCLDVGCGYGRVVRELAREFPECAISVCDTNEEAVRFTAAEFAVRRLPILERMGHERNDVFDLVYLLSVYTHLDRPMVEINLAKAAAVTRPGGIVVFTTYGRDSALRADAYRQYWLDREEVLGELDRAGFFYQRYPYGYDEQGVAWFAADEMKALVAEIVPALDFVAHNPAAVGGDQDVFVYRKR